MPPVIQIKNLKKYYSVQQKEPGLKGSIKSLVKRQYKEVKAVNNISFEIQPGELVGFIGPNGAGKTTTLKVLSGLLHPTSGQVNVLGFDPRHRHHDYLKQIGLIMGGKNQLWWDLPPIETFRLNQAIYEIPNQQYKNILDGLIKILKIKNILTTPVRKLSLGQRMKCELIASLLHSPKVLFLDEPTIGLDVVMQKTIRDFIKEYNQKFNATILLTSHYMEDVKKLAKRVIIINQGKIIFDGQLQDIIDRHAKNKIISLVLSNEVPRSTLEKFGQIKKFQFPQVKLITPRAQAAKTASKLLNDFPIIDLDIEEPPIEAIIRDVFK